MSKRPASADPIKALLQAQGLQQPSAAFSTSLTQRVVERYGSPRAAPIPSSRWVGHTVLLMLTGLLLLTGYALPGAVSVVLAPCLGAVVLGTGSLLWLLEHQRKRVWQPQAIG